MRYPPDEERGPRESESLEQTADQDDHEHDNADRAFKMESERRRSHYANRSGGWWLRQYPRACWGDEWVA